ncbi:MAG: hypothetical protein QOE58_2163 [Actinomycetota bacterium]|nr:hypothetical protein [Actinomycetota bacterium]
MNSSLTRRLTQTFLALALTGASALPAITSAEAATPFCGVHWGSQSKSAGDVSTNVLMYNVRAGRHSCFDRLVIDLAAGQEYYKVGYVTQLRKPGGGPVVPLRGGARLSVLVAMHIRDTHGFPVYRPANPSDLVNVTGWRTFRQVKLAYSSNVNTPHLRAQSASLPAARPSASEYTNIGVGVRARLPFRVLTLPGTEGGIRLVVDVAHQW